MDASCQEHGRSNGGRMEEQRRSNGGRIHGYGHNLAGDFGIGGC